MLFVLDPKKEDAPAGPPPGALCCELRPLASSRTIYTAKNGLYSTNGPSQRVPEGIVPAAGPSGIELPPLLPGDLQVGCFERDAFTNAPLEIQQIIELAALMIPTALSCYAPGGTNFREAQSECVRSDCSATSKIREKGRGFVRPLMRAIMSSRTDWKTMRHAISMMDEVEIPIKVVAVSANRTLEA